MFVIVERPEGQDFVSVQRLYPMGLEPAAASAVLANPALLSDIDDGMMLTLTGLSVDSGFISKLGEEADTDSGPAVLPQFGLRVGLANSNWTWGRVS